MKSISTYIVGFDEIVQRASQEFSIASQASIIAVKLLNSQMLIQFLREVQKHDQWVSKYYRCSAQIASESLISNILTLLTSTMKQRYMKAIHLLLQLMTV